MNFPFFPTLSLAGLSLAILSASIPAQAVGGTVDLVTRFDGSATGEVLGSAVANAGDVDMDGVPDMVVGAPLANPNGSYEGSAFVFSGATGAQLYRFDGPESHGEMGASVAGAGDVNGDGYDDVIVGAWHTSPNGLSNAGSAFVFSGATGAQLFRFDGLSSNDRFAYSVSGVGDINGDGFSDFVVGASRYGPNGMTDAGSAFVFSGATGNQLFRLDGTDPGDFLGNSVAGAGDVNGDGVPDIVVGAMWADPNGGSWVGSAFVFSGATGAQFYRWDGWATRGKFGSSVAGAGDVNGDGYADVIVGATDADPYGIPGAGSVSVFSGATSGLLFRFDGSEPGEYLGWSVSGAGDVNGDGFADVIIGTIYASPNGLTWAGSAFVLLGPGGDQLVRLDGTDLNGHFGWSVSDAGDVNGNGFSEVIVGHPYAYNGGLAAGSVYVYSFNPILTASSETFSISAGGTIDYAIDFPDADGGKKYGVLLSAKGTGPTLFKGLLIPLRKDKYFVASLQGNTPSQGVNFQGVLDPQGQALAHFTALAHSLPSRMIGHSLFLAAINKNFDFVSVARRIDFTL